MISKIYIELRLHYLKFGTIVQFRTQELAHFWAVSVKQTQRRLRHFSDDGLLTYEPGRGRGHLSQIHFLNDFRVELTDTMRHAITINDTDVMFYLFQLGIPTSWLAQFRRQLTNLLGLQVQDDHKRILRQVSTRKITSLDPVNVAIHHEYELAMQLGDTLIKYDNGLQPGLAHHWTSNQSATIWTFYLRKGVQFHNGKEMTSLDVKKTFERVKQRVGDRYWQLINLVKIVPRATDVVEFYFSASEPLFVRFVADAKYIIIDCDSSIDNLHWIGTGAFEVVESTNDIFRLKAFNNYYGFRAMIDEVQYLLVDDDNIAKHLFNPEDYGNYDYIKKQRAIPSAEFVIANMNRKTIIQNVLVREALYNIIDIRYFDRHLGDIASHYNREDSIADYSKSMQQARNLIRKSGYSGESIVLGVLSHIKSAIDMAKWIQERAQQAGIYIEILYYSFTNDYYSDVLEQQVDLVMLADVPMNDDEFAYIEFLTSPTLLVQKMLTIDLKNDLQQMVIQFKQAPTIEQRHTIYLTIDNWLTDHFFMIYTVHAVRDVYIHQFLANGEYGNDYKNAWQMPKGHKKSTTERDM